MGCRGGAASGPAAARAVPSPMPRPPVADGRPCGSNTRRATTGASSRSDDCRSAPDEIYELAGSLRVRGEGTATFCVILYDRQDKALDWSFGGKTVGASDDWQTVKSRFLVPAEAATIVARVIGDGPATVWADDLSLQRVGNLAELRARDLPPTVAVKNDMLELQFDTADAAFTLVDPRSGRRDRQASAGGVAVLAAGRRCAHDCGSGFWIPARCANWKSLPSWPRTAAEAVIQVQAAGPMDTPLAFPAPFQTSPGELLIMPVNEGIGYPVDDASLPECTTISTAATGCAWPWYGVTDTNRGADDDRRNARRRGRCVCRGSTAGCAWRRSGSRRSGSSAARGGSATFSSTRAATWPWPSGIASYAKAIGLLKTLEQKRQENPERRPAGRRGQRLVLRAGRRRRSAARCRQLGIERILWSAAAKPEEIDALNAMGVLTSRYDIYQDCMDPANFPKLRGVHGDWTCDGWPKDIMIDAEGDWIRGWEVEGKDGTMYPCGVLCDRLAPDYARRRIPPELETQPIAAGSSTRPPPRPWRECYSPNHPLTRSESRRWKMELLRVISEEFQPGHRLRDGARSVRALPPLLRRHAQPGTLPRPRLRAATCPNRGTRCPSGWPSSRRATTTACRSGNWSTTIASWPSGTGATTTTSCPSSGTGATCSTRSTARRRCSCSTPKIWEKNRDRFVKSYQTIAPVARATGYSEMLSHQWLTDDHAVQQTRFANGVGVTVNFGDQPYPLPGGDPLPSLECRVDGLP